LSGRITSISELNTAATGTVSQQEFVRMSCVVAGELKALAEAAPPNPEGVGELNSPTAGGAAMSSKGSSGRDTYTQ